MTKSELIKELQHSDSRYKRLAEHSPRAAYQFVMSPEGEFSFPYIGKNIFDFCGVSAEAIMKDANNLLKLILPDFLQQFSNGVLESAKNLNEYKEDIKFILDGDYRWIEVNSLPEMMEDGNILWDGFITDITERKKTEEELLRNFELQQQAERLANLGYFERNWQTGEGLWSDGFYKLLDCNKDEVDCKHEDFMQFVHKEDAERVASHVKNSLITKTKMDIVFRITHRDGSHIHIHGIATNIYTKDDKPLLTQGTFQDITARISAEHESRETQKKLFQSSKLASIGELAAGVSHEIRNPLAIINGNILLLSRNLQKEIIDIPKCTNYLKSQKEGIKRIADIVNGLNTYARMDSDEVNLFEVNNIVTRSVDLIKTIYEKNNDVIVKQDISKVDLITHGNPGKLQQVLINLLANAKDAIQEGHERIIKVQTKSENDKIILTVSDQGIGIKNENIEKIFEAFFTTKDVGKGTGLGLSIVSSIIKEFKGEISVQSEEGKGSTFIVTLPKGNSNI